MTRLNCEDGKLRIRICGGLNCSGNGGGRPLEEAFQHALEATGIADEVEIFRAHCLGECQNGPCVRIAGERFYQVQKADVPEIVRDEVLPRLK